MGSLWNHYLSGGIARSTLLLVCFEGGIFKWYKLITLMQLLSICRLWQTKTQKKSFERTSDVCPRLDRSEFDIFKEPEVACREAGEGLSDKEMKILVNH